MKKLFLTVLALALATSVPAAELVTVIITVTNAPIGNTNSITLNGSTRTFTNSVTAAPGTLIQETNSVPWTTTNLANHLTVYPFTSGQILGQSASNNVRVRGLAGQVMTATLAGNWGFITFLTNQIATPTFNVRVPHTVEAATNQVSIASMLASYLGLSTNALATNSTAGSNFITKGASPLQVVAAPVQFNGGLRGSYLGLTNGYILRGTNINPVLSNGVNYGEAFRSEGIGENSLQLGSNAASVSLRSIAVGVDSLAVHDDSAAFGTTATASTNNATAIGNAAIAMGYGSVALGQGSVASNQFATAIGQASFAGRNGTAVGQGASATNEQAIAVGVASIASGTNSIAIGVEAGATAYQSIAIGSAAAIHTRAVAIGEQAVSTATNQIRLGTAEYTVSIPGQLQAETQTNSVLRGTNVINGRLDLTPRANTGLANGNNAGVILGTNAYVRLSGPSGAYTNAGFAAAAATAGTLTLVQFDNPVSNMTILNNSGVDPTAANRILTGTGGDINFTNNPVMLWVIYDDSVSRWRLATPSR